MAGLHSQSDILERLKEAQKHGDDISIALEALKLDNGKDRHEKIKMTSGKWFKRHFKSFQVIDEMLYLICFRNGEKIALLVIPKSMIPEVLNRAHGNFKSGHPGIQRTRDRLNQFCTWPTLRKDVEDKVKSCAECQKYSPKHMKHVPVTPIKTAKFPMHHVITDLLKMGCPSGGCDYVLVVADCFTRYIVFTR